MRRYAILIMALLLLLCACSSGAADRAAPPVSSAPEPTPAPTPTTAVPSTSPTPAPTPTPTPSPRALIVIDAGHQAHANLGQEPVGPGASETKSKVAGGTSGAVSGVPEYQVNLDIALLLRDELERRGYETVMIRTENDVDLSNAERAAIANDLAADAFLRLHCNGSTDAGANGAMTLCQTANSPYNADLYADSKLLAQSVLDGLVAATGCRREYVWETDSMAGINWSRVPVTLIEVGYLTNPAEEQNLLDASYQAQIAAGIADGVDAYFAQRA